MFYPVLRGIARIALRWYYRDIIVQGRHHIPLDGPVLVVANHPNALVDALLIGTTFPRRVMPTAKATLFEHPWLAWLLAAIGVVPLRRSQDDVPGASVRRRGASGNEGSFLRVTEALRAGAVVLVFPEGISHDRPSLAPMRSGASRMALRAQAAGVHGVRILPVGLVFEQKERPASDVLVRVSPPLSLDAIDESGSEMTAAQLTRQIESALRQVTLNFATDERAIRAVRVAGALASLAAAQEPKAATRTFSSQVEIAARIARATEGLEDASPAQLSRIDAFTARLHALERRSTTSGVLLDRLRLSLGLRRGATLLASEGLLFILAGPVALIGWVAHQPPIRLARFAALRTLRSDPSLDQPAMRTIVFGTVFMIGWYSVLLAAVASWLGLPTALACLFAVFGAGQVEVALSPRLGEFIATAQNWIVLRRKPQLHEELLREADELLAEAGALEAALTAV